MEVSTHQGSRLRREKESFRITRKGPREAVDVRAPNSQKNTTMHRTAARVTKIDSYQQEATSA